MTDPRLHTGIAQQGRGWVAWVVNRDGCEALREKWPRIDRKAEPATEKLARAWVDGVVKQWKERADA